MNLLPPCPTTAPPLSILRQRAARRRPPAPNVVSGPVGHGGFAPFRIGPPSRRASAVRRAAPATGSGARMLAGPPECLHEAGLPRCRLLERRCSLQPEGDKPRAPWGWVGCAHRRTPAHLPYGRQGKIRRREARVTTGMTLRRDFTPGGPVAPGWVTAGASGFPARSRFLSRCACGLIPRDRRSPRVVFEGHALLHADA